MTVTPFLPKSTVVLEGECENNAWLFDSLQDNDFQGQFSYTEQSSNSMTQDYVKDNSILQTSSQNRQCIIAEKERVFSNSNLADIEKKKLVVQLTRLDNYLPMDLLESLQYSSLMCITSECTDDEMDTQEDEDAALVCSEAAEDLQSAKNVPHWVASSCEIESTAPTKTQHGWPEHLRNVTPEKLGSGECEKNKFVESPSDVSHTMKYSCKRQRTGKFDSGKVNTEGKNNDHVACEKEYECRRRENIPTSGNNRSVPKLILKVREKGKKPQYTCSSTAHSLVDRVNSNEKDKNVKINDDRENASLPFKNNYDLLSHNKNINTEVCRELFQKENNKQLETNQQQSTFSNDNVENICTPELGESMPTLMPCSTVISHSEDNKFDYLTNNKKLEQGDNANESFYYNTACKSINSQFNFSADNLTQQNPVNVTDSPFHRTPDCDKIYETVSAALIQNSDKDDTGSKITKLANNSYSEVDYSFGRQVTVNCVSEELVNLYEKKIEDSNVASLPSVLYSSQNPEESDSDNSLIIIEPYSLHKSKHKNQQVLNLLENKENNSIQLPMKIPEPALENFKTECVTQQKESQSPIEISKREEKKVNAKESKKRGRKPRKHKIEEERHTEDADRDAKLQETESTKGGTKDGADPLQEVYSRIKKLNEEQEKKRLASEIPGFNWLEEKIRKNSGSFAQTLNTLDRAEEQAKFHSETGDSKQEAIQRNKLKKRRNTKLHSDIKQTSRNPKEDFAKTHLQTVVSPLVNNPRSKIISKIVYKKQPVVSSSSVSRNKDKQPIKSNNSDLPNPSIVLTKHNLQHTRISRTYPSTSTAEVALLTSVSCTTKPLLSSCFPTVHSKVYDNFQASNNSKSLTTNASSQCGSAYSSSTTHIVSASNSHPITSPNFSQHSNKLSTDASQSSLYKFYNLQTSIAASPTSLNEHRHISLQYEKSRPYETIPSTSVSTSVSFPSVNAVDADVIDKTLFEINHSTNAPLTKCTHLPNTKTVESANRVLEENKTFCGANSDKFSTINTTSEVNEVRVSESNSSAFKSPKNSLACNKQIVKPTEEKSIQTTEDQDTRDSQNEPFLEAISSKEADKLNLLVEAFSGKLKALTKTSTETMTMGKRHSSVIKYGPAEAETHDSSNEDSIEVIYENSNNDNKGASQINKSESNIQVVSQGITSSTSATIPNSMELIGALYRELLKTKKEVEKLRKLHDYTAVTPAILCEEDKRMIDIVQGKKLYVQNDTGLLHEQQEQKNNFQNLAPKGQTPKFESLQQTTSQKGTVKELSKPTSPKRMTKNMEIQKDSYTHEVKKETENFTLKKEALETDSRLEQLFGNDSRPAVKEAVDKQVSDQPQKVFLMELEKIKVKEEIKSENKLQKGELPETSSSLKSLDIVIANHKRKAEDENKGKFDPCNLQPLKKRVLSAVENEDKLNAMETKVSKYNLLKSQFSSVLKPLNTELDITVPSIEQNVPEKLESLATITLVDTIKTESNDPIKKQNQELSTMAYSKTLYELLQMEQRQSGRDSTTTKGNRNYAIDNFTTFRKNYDKPVLACPQVMSNNLGSSAIKKIPHILETTVGINATIIRPSMIQNAPAYPPAYELESSNNKYTSNKLETVHTVTPKRPFLFPELETFEERARPALELLSPASTHVLQPTYASKINEQSSLNNNSLKNSTTKEALQQLNESINDSTVLRNSIPVLNNGKQFDGKTNFACAPNTGAWPSTIRIAHVAAPLQGHVPPIYSNANPSGFQTQNLHIPQQSVLPAATFYQRPDITRLTTTLTRPQISLAVSSFPKQFGTDLQPNTSSISDPVACSVKEQNKSDPRNFWNCPQNANVKGFMAPRLDVSQYRAVPCNIPPINAINSIMTSYQVPKNIHKPVPCYPHQISPTFKNLLPKPVRICKVCLEPAKFLCSNCKTVIYCSENCQV